jgi:hypothetical protein
MQSVSAADIRAVIRLGAVGDCSISNPIAMIYDALRIGSHSLRSESEGAMRLPLAGYDDDIIKKLSWLGRWTSNTYIPYGTCTTSKHKLEISLPAYVATNMARVLHFHNVGAYSAIQLRPHTISERPRHQKSWSPYSSQFRFRPRYSSRPSYGGQSRRRQACQGLFGGKYRIQVKEAGVLEDKKQKSAKKEATVEKKATIDETVMENSENGVIVAAFQELAEHHREEGNKVTGSNYARAANVIQAVPFKITKTNAKSVGTPGKHKVAGIGQKTVNKMLEFLETTE